MPFHRIETRKVISHFRAVCVLATTLLMQGVFALADDINLRPDNRKTYDSAQREAVVRMRKIEGLLTPKILADYTANARAYRDLVYRGTDGRNAKQLEILRIGLSYKIYSLSDIAIQDDPRLIENASKNLDRDIMRAGAGITNADDKKRFRLLLCREAFPMVENLLANNFLSRSLALEALLSMEVVSPRGTSRMEMFDEVHKVIIKVLSDPEQPDSVKLRAANSAKRYLDKADAIPQIENAIARALVAEVQRDFVGVAYQNWLLLALERSATPRQLVSPRQPLAIKAAVEIMGDDNQPIRTRCRAARLAGQAAFDGQVNFEPIAWQVAEVALEVALQYAQSKNKDDPQWLQCGYYLYTAFQADNRAGKQQKKGILNRIPESKVASGAYQALLGTAKVLMFKKGNLNAAVAGLNRWIQANRPDDLVYDATCPPI